MSFVVIGLTGPAGCGKDTIANILVEKYNLTKIALADPLKNGISTMFGIPRDVLDDRNRKEIPHSLLCGKSPRYVMQMLGTEFGRRLIAENVWTRIAHNTIKNIKKDKLSGGVVITDIRFESEAKWFRTISGNLWHIQRDNNPYQISSNHVSEAGVERLPDDILILNDCDIDFLEMIVDMFYKLTKY